MILAVAVVLAVLAASVGVLTRRWRLHAERAKVAREFVAIHALVLLSGRDETVLRRFGPVQTCHVRAALDEYIRACLAGHEADFEAGGGARWRS